MALTITPGYSFADSEVVTRTKLNTAQSGLVLTAAANTVLGVGATAGAVTEIAMTAAGRTLVAAADLAAQQALIGPAGARVRLTAQVDKTNDTTLADLPGMVVTVTAGVTYTLETWLSYTNAANENGNFFLTGTATASALNGILITSGGPTQTGTALPLQIQNRSVIVSVTFTCSGTGTLKWQFSQSLSSATTSSAKLGTYMKLFAY